MTPVGPERISPRESDAVAHAHTRRYGDALRVADSAAAGRVVDDALGAGLSASAAQSLVIAPALVRIGELWAAHAATVADEHLATAISQAVKVKLFERLSVARARARSRERILLAAVEGQHHTVGLRMVADVLEGAGFDVHYLGADVPVDALSQFTATHQPAVTGLAFGERRRRRPRRLDPRGLPSVPDDADHARREGGPTRPRRGRLSPGGQQHGGGPHRRARPPRAQPACSQGHRAVTSHPAPVRGWSGSRFRVRRCRRTPRRGLRGGLRAGPRVRPPGRGSSRISRSATRSPTSPTGGPSTIGSSSTRRQRESGQSPDDRRPRVQAGQRHPRPRRRRPPAPDDRSGDHPDAPRPRFRGTRGRRRVRRAAPQRGSASCARDRRPDPESCDGLDRPAVTVSIGLAPLTADIRGAVLSADSALYEAKRAGRDRVAVATRSHLA